ncbi:hypothetical protein [Pseudomonas jinjuensis]|uniref:Uncharacterized protein n=1 Tax=Pseudomonas jinjuensis TaxID=198616 RepID=A0A1H0IX93_9PSED|nr:hypothetical protein [Pseudomonas jinjuensis]SDO35963.1 hypothetical protein SAMN05216193_110168 [Pseudomonas jinjuensis]
MNNADYEPAFLDDDGPSKDLLTFISTTNARELFGLKEGETVLDAMARCGFRSIVTGCFGRS